MRLYGGDEVYVVLISYFSVITILRCNAPVWICKIAVLIILHPPFSYVPDVVVCVRVNNVCLFI